MESISFTPSEERIQGFVKQYQAHLLPSKNPYIRYFLKWKGVTISIYTSGKVLLQGQDLEELTHYFDVERESSETQKKQSLHPDQAMIGTDEVGNGSYFGGLAVVASFVRPEQHEFLSRLGVGDSKTLTDQKIQQIAPVLKENIAHQALLLSPKKYNEVIASSYNAVSVKVALHNQAIFLLLETGVEADQIVIDAFTSPKNYEKYLKYEKNQVTRSITLEEKAESKYLAVAVSSIIARDLFLENLKQLSEQVGYSLPSGAGAKSDKVASQLLAAYGLEALQHTAKLHFKNTEKAKKLLER